MMSIDQITEKVLKLADGNEEIYNLMEELRVAHREDMKTDLLTDLSSDLWKPTETVGDVVEFIESNY